MGSRLSTKWGAFEVCSLKCMQASAIRQHARYTVHQVALRAFLEPDRAVSELMPCQQGDEGLLRGNVPQPEDWLRAWRACRTPASFSAAEKAFHTEHYIQALRASPVKRRTVRNLVLVMQEAIRIKKREAIRACRSCSLQVDDRKDYRLITFRCDVQPRNAEAESKDPRSTVPLPQAAHFSGVLAVQRHGPDAVQLEVHDNDKSNQVADSILEAMRSLCVPLGKGVDQDLWLHFQSVVRQYVADGGAPVQKAGRALASKLPNLIFVGRDPAHEVRIAAKDPMQAMPRFKDLYDRIFNDRHALVPDIMNSEAWRAKLVSCQERVKQQHGSQGGGLKTVLMHLSFAKQRWDSHADPMMKFCCMLRAIAMLLACVAADPRNDVRMRQRADDLLQSLKPEDLVACALAADYGLETVAFLRTFDAADHDPARTSAEVRAFIRRMQSLFCDGLILCPDPTTSTSDGCKTMTQIVWDQVVDPEEIPYGDKLHFLHTRTTPAKVKEALQDMANVVQAMNERLIVDLQNRELGNCMEIFALNAWIYAFSNSADKELHDVALAALANLGLDHPCRQEGANDASGTVAHMSGLVCQLGAALRLEASMCKTDFVAVVRALLPDYTHAAARSPVILDYRAVWSLVLDPKWRCQRGLQLQSKVGIELLISFYLSTKDGTSTVERQLGTLTDILQKHDGSLAKDGSTAEALTEVCVDGPQEEQEVFGKASGGQHTASNTRPQWQFTEFSRQCADLYISHFGRRFACTYNTHPEREDPRKGTKRPPQQGAFQYQHLSCRC